MPGFDFQALAACAGADHPDAALLDLIEADRTHGKRRDRACKGQRRAAQAELRERFWHEMRENKARLAATRPATLEGLLAKLRHAVGKGRDVPFTALERSALRDAIAWLDPPAPRRRRTPGVPPPSRPPVFPPRPLPNRPPR